MARSRINVSTSGPLFDNLCQDIVRDWLDETKREVADMGVRELDAIVMDKTGRGTGHYQSMISHLRAVAGGGQQAQRVD